MRTTIQSGRTIQYPDNISFAFNREMIIVENTNNAVEFTISANGKTFTDVSEPIQQKVTKDISYYLQLLFNPITAGSLCLDVSIKISIANNDFTFNTYCLWGAISPGETFNPAQRQHSLFNGYPQTFSIFTEQPKTIYLKIDNGLFEEIGTTLQGTTIIPLHNYNPSKSLIFRFGGTLHNHINTFDYTFDYTFRLTPIKPDAEVKFNVSNCADGIFLRWIDRQGFYQYYLLQRKAKNFQTQNNGQAVELDYFAFGKHFNNVDRQNKTETQTVSAFVALANQDDFYTLTSLFTSPLVWAYFQNETDEGLIEEWIPVTIAPAAIAMSAASLQDLNIEITFPQTQIQHL